jgi:hypothetical protein
MCLCGFLYIIKLSNKGFLFNHAAYILIISIVWIYFESLSSKSYGTLTNSLINVFLTFCYIG